MDDKNRICYDESKVIWCFECIFSRLPALIIPNTIIPILDHANEVESGVLQSAIAMLYINDCTKKCKIKN